MSGSMSTGWSNSYVSWADRVRTPPASPVMTWIDGQWKARPATPVAAAPAVAEAPASVPARQYTTRKTESTADVITSKRIADNGLGGFAGMTGASVVYSSGVIHFRPTEPYNVSKYENSRSGTEAGTWRETTNSDSWASGSLVRVLYAEDSVLPVERTHTLDAQPIVIQLAPHNGDSIVPGSVQFRLGASEYIDRDGLIYRGIQPNGSGTLSGTIDYSTGIVTLTDWAAGSAEFELQSLLTFRGQWDESELHFYTEQAPIQPGSLGLSAIAADTGELLTATSNTDGEIVGDYCAGTIDPETGLGYVRFGAWVADASLTDADKAEPWYDPANVNTDGDIWRPRPIIPPSARYNCVVLTFVPVDPEILGLNTVRLPANGRVPQFRPGDFVMLMHSDTTTGTPTLDVDTGKYVLDLGRERVSWVRVQDADGERVTAGYTLKRAAGQLVFDALTGLELPLTVKHTISDLVIARQVLITGRLMTNLPLTHDYPAHDTLVASCLPAGDRRARVSMTWDQKTWNQSWVDHIVGDESLGNMNLVSHPIVVTNLGCITERWAVVWQAGGSVIVYGQERGVVFSGAFTADIAPLNPDAKDHLGNPVPYFILPLAANAGGFTTGNVFRFNTVAAQFGFWIAAAMQQSPVPDDDNVDGCEIRIIGNVNNPIGE